MPYLSRYDIELIAQRVISAYRKHFDHYGQEVDMVQPNLLVCDMLGLSVRHHALSRSGKILGLTSCGAVDVQIFDKPESPEYYHLDGKTLLIDSGLRADNANKGRYNFTLIHEACHQIYRMLFPKEYTSGITRRKVHYCTTNASYRDGDWEEWRTNTLASAILMPADMVLNNMIAFGLGNRLRMLNKVFASPDYKKFEQMANYMGVSKQALAIRLKQLTLLDLDYLQDPYALVNVFPDEEGQNV